MGRKVAQGFLIGTWSLISGMAWSADSIPKSVAWGAFVDSYYGFDFDQPGNLDRSFTTQPARHNEFNVNLVYLEGKLTEEKVHGRLALQAGTSVQSNYAGEP